MEFPYALVSALREYKRSIAFNLSRDSETGHIKLIWRTRKSGKYYKEHRLYLADDLSQKGYKSLLKQVNKTPGTNIVL